MFIGKVDVNKEEKFVSISKFMHVKSIDNGVIRTVENRRLCILKVEPINFNLKSQAEQKIILESYRIFLKQCNFDFQIYVQTQKADAKKHISEVRKCIEYEPQISEMAEDYIDLIKDISDTRGSISRRFFVVFEAKDDDSRVGIVVEGLKSCGNIVTMCDDDEIMKVFNGCFKSYGQMGLR